MSQEDAKEAGEKERQINVDLRSLNGCVDNTFYIIKDIEASINRLNGGDKEKDSPELRTTDKDAVFVFDEAPVTEKISFINKRMMFVLSEMKRISIRLSSIV